MFGEAKEWHGSRRFRLRGLENVNAEALVIASGQNLKRLVAFGPRSPEEEGDGGSPASIRKAIPTSTAPTPHDQSMAFFNTLYPSTH